MSLRLQINLLIAVLMTLFIGTLVYQQVEDTRSSVREEIEGSNRVAIQLLTVVSGAYEQSGVRGMLTFLNQLGRVRANDVSLYDPAGQLVYSSPISVYKSGRNAPLWYTQAGRADRAARSRSPSAAAGWSFRATPRGRSSTAGMS